MERQPEPDRIVFRFRPPEASLLARIFRRLDRQYQTRPEDLDPRIAEAWYSTRGCRTARMSSEETAEWLQHLQAHRGAHRRLLERWGRQLAQPPDAAGRVTLALLLDDAPAFLNILNDHRLSMAARHQLGQEEMDLGFLQALAKKLPTGQQTALLEVEFLGGLMEVVLSRLTGAG